MGMRSTARQGETDGNIDIEGKTIELSSESTWVNEDPTDAGDVRRTIVASRAMVNSWCI